MKANTLILLFLMTLTLPNHSRANPIENVDQIPVSEDIESLKKALNQGWTCVYRGTLELHHFFIVTDESNKKKVRIFKIPVDRTNLPCDEFDYYEKRESRYDCELTAQDFKD